MRAQLVKFRKFRIAWGRLRWCWCGIMHTCKGLVERKKNWKFLKINFVMVWDRLVIVIAALFPWHRFWFSRIVSSMFNHHPALVWELNLSVGYCLCEFALKLGHFEWSKLTWLCLNNIVVSHVLDSLRASCLILFWIDSDGRESVHWVPSNGLFCLESSRSRYS